PDDLAAGERPWSLIGLKGRDSSLSSKSYQYLPRKKAPLSPYWNSRSWSPFKILEKVSPRLKFIRPSSPVEDAPWPPLLVSISLLLGLLVLQLAPIDSCESRLPRIWPISKSIPGAAVATLIAAVSTPKRDTERILLFIVVRSIQTV